jgi:xanthine dehydrogenase accessory factor
MDLASHPWATFGYADDVRPALTRLLPEGPAALATITRLEGGGPRPVGTQMVFGASEVSGFLSGGCIESDVALHAAACLRDGEPRELIYGEGSPWPDIRLLCGASLTVLVERVAPDDPAAMELLAMTLARRPAIWLTDGERRLCAPAGEAVGWPGAFMRSFDPPWRLVVLGGDPTALAVASLGIACGYETILVRAKGPLEPPPIAGLTYRRDGPDTALAAIAPDAWTAIAVCHHDLDLDEAGLRASLPTSAAYVGLLGGRARLAERLARLGLAGLARTDLARLRAPIGLNLGGKAPFEIALAVLGEITALRHGGPAALGLIAEPIDQPPG